MIILDDNSNDDTPQILAEIGREERLHLIRGEDLPAGWDRQELGLPSIVRGCQG